MTMIGHRYQSVLGLAALGVLAPMQGTTSEPWKLVPALPANSCFADDGFGAKVQEAEQAAMAARERQDELNAKIKKQFDEMDMTEKGQRMQAWMMKNPQAATQMLQASADPGGAANIAADMKATTERLDKELENHKTAFTTAIDQAVRPFLEKEKAFTKAKAIVVGEAQQYVFTTAADHAAYVAIINEQNAAHEKACAPFYGANGVFRKWLSEFKSEVTDKALAAEARGNAIMVQQMAIMDTPTGGYRSTGGYDVVRDYLRHLHNATSVQRWKAAPTIRLMVK
jgi:Fe-S cluster assembly iron-binding protein IscA